MDKIVRINNITELMEFFQQEKPTHPLIAVIDFSKVDYQIMESFRLTAGFYSIMLKEKCNGAMRYGRQYYDFQEGTLVFIAPDQVISMEPDEDGDKPSGWSLMFHPDLLRGTTLAPKMKEYSFFSYDVNEALHLSDREKLLLNDILKNIDTELSLNIDKHSQQLLVSNIELMLNYCMRFYDRQFLTRHAVNKDVLTQFENVLKEYFHLGDLKIKGLPSVKFCAEQLNLSANYLSDLLKKETGKSAQEHIHTFLIETAKNKLLGTSDAVSQIAYDLGFDYPQYFSKMFKKKTGMSPKKFRELN